MSEQTTLVRVTREHIRLGEPSECSRCPVALAMLDAFSVAEVAVDVMEIGIRFPGEGWTWSDTPRDVADFIEAFDGRRPAEPFNFTLTWRVGEDLDAS